MNQKKADSKFNIKSIFSLKYLCLLVTLIFSVLIFPQKIKEIIISNNGEIINAAIIKMPEKCAGKNNFADFKYLDHEFNKRVWKDFCKDYRQGEFIEFYHMDKYPKDYVFKVQKETYSKVELLSTILLVHFFGGTTYYLFKTE
ncbi:MAG: hypothetical protein MH472_03520 [Bacteroidia bacterium]|nr:hypothetical protein [Bacteroidia bacterium]